MGSADAHLSEVARRDAWPDLRRARQEAGLAEARHEFLAGDPLLLGLCVESVDQILLELHIYALGHGLEHIYAHRGN